MIGNTCPYNAVMYYSVAFFSVLILPAIISSTNGECYHGWIHFEDSCYMFSNTEETWIMAEASCMSHHARLAEVYSKNQSDFLNDRVKSSGNQYWLGARDDVIEGEWQWASSEVYFSFTDWAPGFPNSYEERCLVIDIGHDYQWDDSACRHSFRYICEKATTTEGCTQGWLLFEDMCYFISHHRESWLSAQGRCKVQGSRLVEVNNAGQRNFLVGTLRNQSVDHDYWVGGKEEPTTSVWQWSSTGQPFTFTDWAPHKPGKHDYVDKDCLKIHDRWEDAPCHSSYRYICEKSLFRLQRMFKYTYYVPVFNSRHNNHIHTWTTNLPIAITCMESPRKYLAEGIKVALPINFNKKYQCIVI